ncbi:hypothetical protein [Saccharibacillus alkalitolerans]|uniref:Uncharacterized protein n=1 Tax=Saccharibacillus alkalitolerans TaxID=2705290 RepID=A0ABX0F418_9BACL|nr:hypothetical protein [Saccharibacillus alkalitolerans]NGZ75727.1 hypothetical protein [Saccharibacillus alkalitolerans]
MKYFKPEYWTDMQSLEPTEESDRLWETGIAEYLAQLEGLQTKLSARNYAFFRHDSLHDGYVTDLIVTNQNAARMKAEGRYGGVRIQQNPITVTVEVLSREFVYTLKFSKVSRFSVDSPAEELLPGSSGFGDWGYAELTEVQDALLRYEVLFSSGATMLIEFAGFSYGRKKFAK